MRSSSPDYHQCVAKKRAKKRVDCASKESIGLGESACSVRQSRERGKSLRNESLAPNGKERECPRKAMARPLNMSGRKGGEVTWLLTESLHKVLG